MTYSIVKQEDIKFGKKQEKNVFPKLKNFFSDGLKQTDETKGMFCRWDYEDSDKKIFVELKSRRISFSKYKTTFLDVNKLVPAKRYLDKNPNGEWWFCFNFTDGLYYVNYYDIEYLKGTAKPTRISRGDVVCNITIPIHLLGEVEEGFCLE